MGTIHAKDQLHGLVDRIERVAIVGGGGQIGKHILEQILKTGNFIVTAIQRPNSTNKLPNNINIIHADYNSDDDTALVKALEGQQALIITMAVTAPRDTIGNLIRAAAKANVSYILPNWYGHDAANDQLCKDSLLLERRDTICNEIKSLGVSSYILLVCGFWYEFSLAGGPDRFGFDFHNRSLTWFDDGNVAINSSTWSQCGRAVAKLLSLKLQPYDVEDKSPTLSQFANQSVYISSFRISQQDIFESVKRVTGTTDAEWIITRESSLQRWKDGVEAVVQRGEFAQFTKMLYSRMFFANGDGDHESSHGLDNDVLGLPIEDLDEYTALAVRMAENGEVPYGH